MDVEGLKSRISLSELVTRYGVELKKDGDGWKGYCPAHQENTPSFGVNDDKGFCCFGCGFKGSDVISFVRQINNLPDDKEGFKEACRLLADMVNHDLNSDTPPPRAPRRPREPEPEDIWQAVPGDENWRNGPLKTVPVYNPKKDKTYPINFVANYEYRDTAGTLIGVILRSEREGEKFFQTITYRTNTQTGDTRWVVMAMSSPRPIYGADLIAANPGAQILLVEGEKACHAARDAINSKNLIPVTWPGGSKAIDKVDWSPLQGRKIVAWPDCDSQVYATGDRAGMMMPYHEQGGMAAVLKIAEKIDAYFKVVKVPQPGEVESGWDLADAVAEGWTRQNILDYIRNHSDDPGDVIPKEEEGYVFPDEPEFIEPNTELATYENQPSKNDPFDDGVIKFLGWDSGSAYYLPHGFKQVVSLRASEHTNRPLLAMAPLSYWLETFPSFKRSGDSSVDWDLAADSFFRRSQQKGVFDPNKIRGRGAWFDAGRSVVHAGDKLVVDGSVTELSDMNSRYIYPLAQPMDVTLEDPLSNAEAVKFANICEMIRWEDPISARLLAGWCFLAPICGAIDWRPHLWLTGPAGSGKSTVLSKIMRPALGSMMIHAAGDTTEAGLRQRLRQDALPVLFDEFESEREQAAKKTQDVLALVRQSSSDTGAEIIKGGAAGKSDSYMIRSMFAFASIVVALNGQADESRLTVLSMKGLTQDEKNDPEIQKQWQGLSRAIVDILTPEYIHKLQARAIKMIPVIRQNIESFSNAIALSPALGGKRLGDQVGTLLAGAYSLYSAKPIDLDGAIKWIESQDWSGVSNNDTSADESTCIKAITSHIIRVDGNLKPQNMTVAELIDIVCEVSEFNDNVIPKVAEDTLGLYGIRCIKDQDHWVVAFSNNSPQLAKILRNTAYSSWSRVLMRLEGAKKRGTTRFAGVPDRAVQVPLDTVRGEVEVGF